LDLSGVLACGPIQPPGGRPLAITCVLRISPCATSGIRLTFPNLNAISWPVSVPGGERDGPRAHGMVLVPSIWRGEQLIITMARANSY